MSNPPTDTPLDHRMRINRGKNMAEYFKLPPEDFESSLVIFSAYLGLQLHLHPETIKVLMLVKKKLHLAHAQSAAALCGHLGGRAVPLGF
ncbi:hypothetical protein AX14_012885 [Amanita brunnescens Koide BX004]|nr:hypothetical protein AX14_012885 [Amanita brunnescens Koide BX004]